jgi:hypothetical protein
VVKSGPLGRRKSIKNRSQGIIKSGESGYFWKIKMWFLTNKKGSNGRVATFRK